MRSGAGSGVGFVPASELLHRWQIPLIFQQRVNQRPCVRSGAAAPHFVLHFVLDLNRHNHCSISLTSVTPLPLRTSRFVIPFTFHASRITHHASRLTFHASRSTLSRSHARRHPSAPLSTS